MIFDLLVKNGRLVTNNEIIHGSIGVINGKIAAIITDASDVNAREIVDANNDIVLPGLTDVDVHMRTPGLEHKEDFRTGTSAAAAGGVTTILDMPNTKPPTTTVERLAEKKEMIKEMSVVDYGLHFQGAQDNLDQLKVMEGVVSAKFFMAGHETTPTTVSDVGILYDAFKVLAQRGLPVCVHAEHQQLINARKKYFEGREDWKVYSEWRNDSVCVTAVKEAISLAQETGCRLHICHVSTEKEIKAIRQAQDDGVIISVEIVPYHLFLTQDDCERLGSGSKVSPALKTQKDQQALWEAIDNNGIDNILISSEHTPHTKEEKSGSVWKATSGAPGIQETLPLLIKRGLPLTKIAKLCAENPASFFGLREKGKIQIGYDADFVILNPQENWTVKTEDVFSKCGWSNYVGWDLKGKPKMTLVRGTVVYKDGKVIKPNTGKFVSPN
jgi:dihydroorotase